VGDGNLHLTVTSAERSPDLKAKIEPFIFEWVAEAKGSISAEHGLGEERESVSSG
jgi:FAD/FMN-containing dehydrogenase